MRRKAFKASSSRHSSPATALQLQQTKLEFHQRLNSLTDTVLQQARAFSEHLASCTSMDRMVNNLANLTRIGPASVHHSQPFHHNEDPAAPDQNSTSTISPPCISASHGSLLPRSQFAYPSSSHTKATSQSRDNSLSTKSVSATLPRLRGYFNKPKQKLEHDRCG